MGKMNNIMRKRLKSLIVFLIVLIMLIQVSIFVYAVGGSPPPPSSSSCFPSGTLISMADGSQKPIEEVDVGEMIYGYDTNTNELKIVEVLELESPMREGFYMLTFTGGSILNITNEHPIYIRRGNYVGWGSIDPTVTIEDSGIIAKKIELGDEIFTLGKEWLKIENIEYVDGPIQTYNLKKVSETNTFFAEGILVHNKGRRRSINIRLQSGYYTLNEATAKAITLKGDTLPTGTILYYDQSKNRITKYYYKGKEYDTSSTTSIEIDGKKYTVFTTLSSGTKKILQKNSKIYSKEITEPEPTIEETTKPAELHLNTQCPGGRFFKKATGVCTSSDDDCYTFSDTTYRASSDGKTICSCKGRECTQCYPDKDPNCKSFGDLAKTDCADRFKKNDKKTECIDNFKKTIEQHKQFNDFIKEQREFTFGEGVELGSTLWSLGTEYGFWTEASNPMSQLNEFFSNNKVGLFLSGEWEKSICWETTDFNSPNDGVAFVPGTNSVGAWVAAEYTPYNRPDISDPTRTLTGYIIRITSMVNPTGLSVGSGSANCLDIIQFQYSLGGHALDLDMDGKTSDDVIRLQCDSASYSLTGQNTIVRYVTALPGNVCIRFQSQFLKPAFLNSLSGGELCAPVVPAGFQYGTGCSWCPGIFTAQAGAPGGVSYGGFGGGSASAGENRPGTSNPASVPS